MDIRRATRDDLKRANQLLLASARPPLPRDLALSNVLVALDAGRLVGVVAMEVRGLEGWICSAAIAEGADAEPLVASLMQALISRASELSLRDLFLCRGDVDDAFAATGFGEVAAEDVPSSIRTLALRGRPAGEAPAFLRLPLTTRFV